MIAFGAKSRIRFSSSMAGSAGHSARAERVGNGDDRRARHYRHVRRTRHVRREAFDGCRLPDVERLPLGGAPVVVDQADVGRDMSARQRVRQQTAQLAAAEDRHLIHLSCAIVMGEMDSIRGKVAMVTGGSRGIGLAIASALVAEGVSVSVTGLHDASLSAARAQIESAGPAAVETLRADVRRYEDVEHALAATVGRFGGLDILVNNAGVGIFADVADMTPGQWSEIIDTNLTGVFNACHAAIPHLRRRGGGYIVNISSLSGHQPLRPRRRVLRVEGRTECVQRIPDAGAAVRRHPRELRDAGLGGDRVRAGRIVEGRRLEGGARRGRRCRAQPAAAPRPEHAEPRRDPAHQAREEMTPPAGQEVTMSVFDKHRDTLEHHETMMGSAGGRLAVALDLLTDSLALVGQHGVYCRSERFPGKPRMDIALVLEQLDDAKQLVQSALEELRAKGRGQRCIGHSG